VLALQTRPLQQPPFSASGLLQGPPSGLHTQAPFEQVGVAPEQSLLEVHWTHVPFEQNGVAPGQTLSQAPQLLGSLCRLKQSAPHLL
jgi:hypothetical protein